MLRRSGRGGARRAPDWRPCRPRRRRRDSRRTALQRGRGRARLLAQSLLGAPWVRAPRSSAMSTATKSSSRTPNGNWNECGLAYDRRHGHERWRAGAGLCNSRQDQTKDRGLMQPAPRVSSPQFRLRWRGYDRAEVDEFLRRTAADRQRLHEDLAQIDTIIAGRRGSRTSEPARVVAVEANAGRPALEAEPAPKPVRATSIGRRYLAMSVISVVALPLFIFASLYVTRGGNPTAADVAGSQDASTSGMTHGSVALPGAAAVDGLLITLTARRPCWVRTAVDGNEPVERLLQQNDTMLVR